LLSRLKALLARRAYSALLCLITPAYLGKLWWRGRVEPGYRQAVAQRFGWGLPACAPGAVWVHAVSLGETLAAAALIAELRRQHPGLRLLLTHGTATGRAAGQALLGPGDVQTWLPVDTPGAVRRFLRALQPAVGVLMETELWPNLLHHAQSAGVPMVLANARLSERSARKGERFASLLGPAVQALRLALAQTEADAERLCAAGVTQVQVSGNLKFDLSPDASLQTQGRAWRQVLGQRPVLALTNSRDGEEAMLLAAWAQVPAPRPLLLIVPRHPQRFEEVAKLVEVAGLHQQRRSQWGSSAPPESAASADVWLGDSLGEMSLYYSLADVALLGGSFMPLGGHNLIEAAANGCPLWMGPSTFNFALAAEMAVAAGAAWQLAGMTQAVNAALSCLAQPPQREAAATRALAFAAEHRGAARRMATEILALLPSLPALGTT
jgi:3-deoxy-D-manno-octulosonic-acid transferase